MSKYALFWFRRDLRLNDNHGLFQALSSGIPVIPLFIFDTSILDKLEDEDDARVSFIYQTLKHLKEEIAAYGSCLRVEYGTPQAVFSKLIEEDSLASVYTNSDYEPQAIERDAQITVLLNKVGIAFHTFKDQVVFEKNEIVKENGEPYVVYTPYSKAWKKRMEEEGIPHYPSESHLSAFKQGIQFPFPAMEALGFKENPMTFPPVELDRNIIRNYKDTRDYPAIRGTSRLSVHFRFGTVSIREKVHKAKGLSEKYLNELIWRDFYQMILFHFPRVVNHSFKPAYDRIIWRNNEAEFQKWMEGKTGYPLVDAGMRELIQTGYMHNRVRMVVASFLCKHLLIDWRWGEAWFARKLLDFDLASNNGGWQWAAGTGVDAAPYFRVFNPELQQKKFDPDFEYIKKWVPEFGTSAYPKPMVDHVEARDRCLKSYQVALSDKA
ncbi:MAG: deoxyribodipyrimidine photo-lyase [Bacteroidetes bacterium]|nr:deoxyribodipyrimidine photo-lyase [Bacteroidota bacterium]